MIKQGIKEHFYCSLGFHWGRLGLCVGSGSAGARRVLVAQMGKFSTKLLKTPPGVLAVGSFGLCKVLREPEQPVMGQLRVGLIRVLRFLLSIKSHFWSNWDQFFLFPVQLGVFVSLILDLC